MLLNVGRKKTQVRRKGKKKYERETSVYADKPVRIEEGRNLQTLSRYANNHQV
jgi:hypothetical protein